jgi:hypothetical protein
MAHKKARGEKPNLVDPLAVGAVKRIDAHFEIERAINGLSADQRYTVRQDKSALGDRRRALDERDARQPRARTRSDQAPQLHAALAPSLHPLPDRRADLPLEQCR